VNDRLGSPDSFDEELASFLRQIRHVSPSPNTM
jgi:hypothetical protein